MPKRAAQSDEKCRTPKVVRNKDDLSERKISRSKLNRKKRTAKLSSSFFRLVFLTAARSFFLSNDWIISFLLGSMTGRQGALQLRAPTKNSDGKTPSDIFYVGLPTYVRRVMAMA